MQADVYAQEVEQDVDFSELLTEDALIGYAQLTTRGVYLTQGLSTINDAGGGKIGAGGITNAAVRCTVSCNSIVERKEGTSWYRVKSWTTTNTNAYLIMSARISYIKSSPYFKYFLRY